jgi:hypothetical protein
VDPLPLEKATLVSARVGYEQPVTIEHDRARDYTAAITLQIAELGVVHDLAIAHLKRAAVGYEAYDISWQGSDSTS